MSLVKSVCCLIILISQSSMAGELVIAGSGTDLGTFRLLAAAYNSINADVNIKVLPSMGSSGGIKALKHKKIDLALLSRALKEKEQAEYIKSVYYASTPLVIAVADSSAQEVISSDQLSHIYTGKITSWPDGAPVRPILRPAKDSDTQLLVNALIKCKDCFYQIYKRRGIPVALTDQDSADMISRVPGAVGTSTLALILSEKKPLKPLRLNGVEPSPMSIRDKTYPLYKDLFYAYNIQNTSPELKGFLAFIQSEGGKVILRKTGHMIDG